MGAVIDAAWKFQIRNALRFDSLWSAILTRKISPECVMDLAAHDKALDAYLRRKVTAERKRRALADDDGA